MPWGSRFEYADLRLENDEITHVPSGMRTQDTALVALLRSHPQPIKGGLSKLAGTNRWLQQCDSEIRVHFYAVGRGPKAWLERGDDARLPGN